MRMRALADSAAWLAARRSTLRAASCVRRSRHASGCPVTVGSLSGLCASRVVVPFGRVLGGCLVGGSVARWSICWGLVGWSLVLEVLDRGGVLSRIGAVRGVLDRDILGRPARAVGPFARPVRRVRRVLG